MLLILSTLGSTVLETLVHKEIDTLLPQSQQAKSMNTTLHCELWCLGTSHRERSHCVSIRWIWSAGEGRTAIMQLAIRNVNVIWVIQLGDSGYFLSQLQLWMSKYKTLTWNEHACQELRSLKNENLDGHKTGYSPRDHKELDTTECIHTHSLLKPLLRPLLPLCFCRCYFSINLFLF